MWNEDERCGMLDEGCGMRDEGCGMTDEGCRMRDTVFPLFLVDLSLTPG